MEEGYHCSHHIKQEEEKRLFVRLTTLKHHTEQRNVCEVQWKIFTLAQDLYFFSSSFHWKMMANLLLTAVGGHRSPSLSHLPPKRWYKTNGHYLMRRHPANTPLSLSIASLDPVPFFHNCQIDLKSTAHPAKIGWEVQPPWHISHFVTLASATWVLLVPSTSSEMMLLAHWWLTTSGFHCHCFPFSAGNLNRLSTLLHWWSSLYGPQEPQVSYSIPASDP